MPHQEIETLTTLLDLDWLGSKAPGRSPAVGDLISLLDVSKRIIPGLAILGKCDIFLPLK